MQALEKPTIGWMAENEAVADDLRTRRHRRVARASRDCIRNSMVKAMVVVEAENDGVAFVIKMAWCSRLRGVICLFDGSGRIWSGWFTRLTTVEVSHLDKLERWSSSQG